MSRSRIQQINHLVSFLSQDIGISDAIAKSVTSTKRGGQGVGLRICRQIIRRHAGEIVLENDPGRGATFVIKLSEE